MHKFFGNFIAIYSDCILSLQIMSVSLINMKINLVDWDAQNAARHNLKPFIIN